MRKVTKRLLTVVAAAMVAGACQDNLIIQDPPPPPPPPPPPAVDATVSILGLDLIPGPGSANPTAIAGDINVSLNVEEGDNTVTQVDLLFNGTPVGCTSINTSVVPGRDISASSAGGADVIECFWNTDSFAGACTGANAAPGFPNGTHTLGAQITLDDGTTRTASNTQQVTLVNSDLIVLEIDGTAQTLVSQGVTWRGGPRDLDGDGTDDNPVDLHVCPVSFNGTTVAQIGVGETDPGSSPASVDIDGAGTTATATAEPFTFPIDPADNAAVESVSSGAPGDGFDFATFGTGGVVGTILDDTGLNVTSQFAAGTLMDIYLDFLAPDPTGATLELDGDAGALLAHYSAGDFGTTGVVEMGVGFSFGNGAMVDVGDCTDSDFTDVDTSTPFAITFAASPGVGDHTEDDWEAGGDGFAGTDAGGVDCYGAELSALADDLGNSFDLTTIPALQVTDYGVDMTPPAESDVMPASNVVLNPDPNADGGVCADADDCTVMFTAADPDLASGDPGSQVDGPAATAEDETMAVLPVTFTGPDMYSIDISSLADGPHTITATVPDLALPANDHVFEISFDLDDTAPIIGALDPAPVGSAGTDASAIVMTIGETVNDAHIITTASLIVNVNGSDAMGTGASADCTAAQAANNMYPLDVSAGEIDRNIIDLTNGTNSIDFTGAEAEAFTIQDPFGAGVGGTINYCFLLSALDEAVDKSGNASPNASALLTQVNVTWNP